jgi:protein gp37
MTNPIGWCDRTCNPITGCLRACEYCYARKLAQRLAGRYGYPKDEPFRPTFHEDKLLLPQTWKKPQRIFMCSMSDIVGPWTPNRWTYRVLRMADSCPRHTFIFLTKSPARLPLFNPWPANAWVGATVDVRARLAPTLAALRHVKAPVKFICFEPLLEDMGTEYLPDLSGIQWVIIGAQTGPHPFQPEPKWVLDLVRAAVIAKAQVYMKDNLAPCEANVELKQGSLGFSLPKLQQFPGVKR